MVIYIFFEIFLNTYIMNRFLQYVGIKKSDTSNSYDDDDLSKFLRNNQNDFYKVLKKNKLLEIQALDELIRINEAKSIIDKNTALECQICMDKRISICLVPCGHCFCGDCIKNEYRCHICNQETFIKQQLYI